jgi:NADPH:quinone reductase-like Zn-dependent oxidoreductase
MQTESPSAPSFAPPVSAAPGPGISKIVIHKAGGHDRLELEHAPMPAPGAGEVLIEVKASGVNFADTTVRMGLYASAQEVVGWPITPGFEVAGVVRKVGPGVVAFAVGDEVMGVMRFGGYASHVVIDQRTIFKKPAQLSFAEAAAMPVVFLTAWFALHELVHPRPGQKLLIHSASGGVGSALVQLGKLAGCEVVAVVGGAHKVALARELGADQVIDKSTQDLWAEAGRLAPGGYDVVLDANGVSTMKQSYRHLARPGKLVIYGFASMMPRTGGKPNWPKLAYDYVRTPRFNPLDLTNASASVLAFNLSYLFDKLVYLEDGMRDINRWIAAGQIKPPPVTTYPLAEVARAHADIESGKTVGKLILLP